MTRQEFDRWHNLLKQHFPDHPRLDDSGWYPGRSWQRPCAPGVSEHPDTLLVHGASLGPDGGI